MIDEILNIFESCMYGSFIFDMAFMWIIIIINIILNYLVFGLKNIKIHLLNIYIVFVYLSFLVLYQK